ncbi:MAG: fumarylacetoacetate hydrolase family protein [Acaryochloridaceae cyanobacterium RL_2_7]|nr:fumarylacetoacetate hydrolase family protein [Acaryochloridaceae cyanobacterium RL_2_7]
MVERYVRVQTADGKIYYGLLQLNREVHVFEGPPWRTQSLTHLVLAPSDYRFLAPCIPSKIVGIDHNHRITTHRLADRDNEPILFLKPPTAVVGTKSSVPYPHISQYVDAEGELAIVVGKRCKDCPPDAAEQFIWGYTIANDLTARDLETKDQQSTRAKGFDGFCPLGPWIVPNLSFNTCLKTFVNEELRQSSCLDQTALAPHEILSFVSHVMALLPGDVILTGTSSGVGPLHIGDRIRVEIESVGSLENQLIATANH